MSICEIGFAFRAVVSSLIFRVMASELVSFSSCPSFGAAYSPVLPLATVKAFGSLCLGFVSYLDFPNPVSYKFRSDYTDQLDSQSIELRYRIQ